MTRHLLDARGERCPLPVIRLARMARELSPGDEVEILATDPAARHDVPAWCRMRGHRVVSVIPDAVHLAPSEPVLQLVVALGDGGVTPP